MNRREFLTKSCAACLGATAVSALVSSCASTRYTSGTLGQDGLTVSMDEFKIKKQGQTAYLPYIIVRNDSLQYPIYVYRFGETEYSALWMRCAHQGAELQAAGDQLHCPCTWQRVQQYRKSYQWSGRPRSAQLSRYGKQ
jgi:hypothetical protein